MKMIWKKARLAEMSSHKMIAFLSTEDRRNKYVIYHTLELQASKHRGVLRYSESRAFTHEELAKLCYTDLDSLEKALAECKKYELIHEEADGTLIFLEEVEIVSNSQSSGAMSDAERSRRYRERKRQKSIEGAIGTVGQDARGATENHAVTPRDAPAVTQLTREDKNRIRKEEDKEIESTPHNPPQGGDVVDLSYKSDSSVGDDQWESTNPNTNGSSGFAKQRNEPASQITREELAEWVKNEAPKTTMTITKADEDAFWNWLVAARFKNGKGRLITKWNVGKTIFYFIENRRKDGGKPKSVSATARDIMWQTTHLQQEGYEVRD